MNQTRRDVMLSKSVQESDFAALCKSFIVPEGAEALMLLENLPRFVVPPEKRQDLLLFRKLDLDKIDVASYTSGRLFHVYGELRWERQQDSIQIVYMGDPSCMPALDEGEKDKEVKEALDAYKAVTRRYFLFGTRFDRPELGTREGDFAEVRIPRLLRYPVPPGLAGERYIKLAVCEYLDLKTGATVAYRFQGLVADEKEGVKGEEGHESV